MRIVFFGTPEIAVPTLDAVAGAHHVTAVVCQPDRPQGRGRHAAPCPVKQWAIQHEVETAQPEKLNDGAFEAWLKSQHPDLCIIVAYGRILKAPILAVPPKGFLNLHPSLLPKYRGPSPVQSAILNGDSVTGVTVMDVTLEMDAGDILLQREEPILPDDNAESLGRRLAERGAALFIEALDLVASGRAHFTPQDPGSVTYCKLFEKENGLIHWNDSATRIYNLVRAAYPWPCAFTPFRGDILRILKTSPADYPAPASAVPGEVIGIAKDRLFIATGEGSLALLELQAPGKRPMAVADFLRGRPVSPGERMGD